MTPAARERLTWRGGGGDMARVLIIDDDVSLRQTLAKYLERAGHDVRQAGEGDAGIRAHQQRAADVVIVDIFMPGQGGLQTIDQLRRQSPAVKIVAMSGAPSTASLDVAGHPGALGAGRVFAEPLQARTPGARGAPPP